MLSMISMVAGGCYSLYGSGSTRPPQRGFSQRRKSPGAEGREWMWGARYGLGFSAQRNAALWIASAKF